ncbi:MAG: hypothetical protein FD138_2390 [Planctomycetota bacterium]|nr:MAG: hypothetical protein FD138_2390 [Planctomycetota bacterium]
MQVVAAQLAFDGFDVLRRADAFGAVVEFDDEVEGSAIGREELEGAVGIEHRVGGFHADGILASEVTHLDAESVRGDERLHNKIGETLRVVMVTDPDLFKVTAIGQGRIGAMKQPEAIASQFPVVRRATVAGRGIRPRTNPADMP